MLEIFWTARDMILLFVIQYIFNLLDHIFKVFEIKYRTVEKSPSYRFEIQVY